MSQFTSAMPEISVRLQPNSSSSGFRKTASEKVMPTPTVTIAIAAASTIQP
jgi:hypothetical protein